MAVHCGLRKSTGNESVSVAAVIPYVCVSEGPVEKKRWRSQPPAFHKKRLMPWPGSYLGCQSLKKQVELRSRKYGKAVPPLVSELNGAMQFSACLALKQRH